VISFSSSADFLAASARTTSEAASSTFIFATSSWASKSLERPLLILSAKILISECFSVYTTQYVLRKER